MPGRPGRDQPWLTQQTSLPVSPRNAIVSALIRAGAPFRPLRQLRIQVGSHQRTNTFFVIEYHEREVSGELHEER